MTIPDLAMLDDLWLEMQRGRITEADLRDPGFHLDGLCDHGTDRVYVNPKPSVVETLLHELIHRKFKRWGERRVDREAKRLLGGMSSTDIARWYRQYQAAARKRKRPYNLDD